VERLAAALREADEHGAAVHFVDLDPVRKDVLEILARARLWLGGDEAGEPPALEALSKGVAARRARLRLGLLHQTAEGHERPLETGERLAALRWLDRIGYHVWRGVHHLGEEPGPPAPLPEPPPPSSADAMA
jgi:hypothetical protein